MAEQSRCTTAFTRPALPSSRDDDRSELLQALNAHAGLIIASAARILGNLADAEDVAQDIAEKLLNSSPPDVRSWPAYLKTLAVNKAVDRLRRRRDWADPEPREGNFDPEAALYNDQLADILRRAIANLSERDGRLFSLYYFGDLTHGDIAVQMNMTANAVGVALHRVRARLTSEISGSLDSSEGGTVK